MGNISSDERIALINLELRSILSSKQFANAPILRAFLEFVVTEAVNGHGDRLKAYTIAVQGFGRKSDFDPTSDTIVRTTAGRVRKALQAYYQARPEPPLVVITLPRGGYTPSFDIRDHLPAPQTPAPEQISATDSVSAPISAIPPPEPSKLPVPMLRRFLRWDSLVIACSLAIIALGIVAAFNLKSTTSPLPQNVVINVHPVEYVDEQAQTLAREIDIRLAPALSRIKLARIIPPGASDHRHEVAPTTENAPENSIFFDFRASITNDAPHELIWKLTDIASNHILWSAKEPLPELQATTIDEVVDKVAFQILSTGGAVSSSLAKYQGEMLSRPTCLFRAQIVKVIEDDIAYPKVHDCLQRIIAAAPNDAAAWAVLSNFYTIRSLYYLNGNQAEQASLIENAERAAQKAAELAPQDYLTKIALMHLSLRQGKVAEFDALQRELRKTYPGDIYTQISIASRLARLGRGKEALEIFEQAETDFGINLKNWSGALAIAYFAEGDYEQAYRESLRITSDLRFTLVIKAAVLGKINRIDDAVPVIRELVAAYPDIKKSFYGWLTGIAWAEPLIRDIADGLAKAELVVDMSSGSKPDSLPSSKYTAPKNPI